MSIFESSASAGTSIQIYRCMRMCVRTGSILFGLPSKYSRQKHAGYRVNRYGGGSKEMPRTV